MPSIYEALKEMHLAKCEIIYLGNLLASLDNSPYALYIVSGLKNFKSFHTELASQLDLAQTNYPLTVNDAHRVDANAAFADKVYLIYKNIRSLFHNAHEKIISVMDIQMENHIKTYQSYITHALKQAEMYLQKTSNTNNGNDIEKDFPTVKKIFDDLSSIQQLKRLGSQLNEIQEAIKASLTGYDALMPNQMTQQIKFIEEYYPFKLKELNKNIINSFTFICSKEYDIKSMYDTIVNVTSKLAMNQMVFFKSPNVSNTPIPVIHLTSEQFKKQQLIEAIAFLKSHISFFSAPFTHGESFQTWALANKEKMRPISEGLWYFLTSPDQLTMFKKALIGSSDIDTNCLRAGNEALMEWFLLHPCSEGFANYLLTHVDTEIIDQWQNERHPRFYHHF